RTCFLVVLQLATHSCYGHIGYLCAGRSVARRSGWRRRFTILGAGLMHGADCLRAGFHCVAGQGRRDRELHFRKRPRRIQVWYRLVYSRHTVAEALWIQRITRRFLGTLRLLLFAPPGNKRGVAPARSLRAGCAATWQTLSEEQTGSLVRCHCWDCRSCEHGCRQVGRETTGPSTTGTAAVRASSSACVRPQRSATPRARLFPSWHGGNRCSRSHVRGQARLSFRPEPGTARH